MFSTILKANFDIWVTSILSSANAFNLDWSKIFSFVRVKPLPPLPDDKILDWSDFKAFADDELKVVSNAKFAHVIVENIVRKGEMLVNSTLFSFFRNVFDSFLLLQGR